MCFGYQQVFKPQSQTVLYHLIIRTFFFSLVLMFCESIYCICFCFPHSLVEEACPIYNVKGRTGPTRTWATLPPQNLCSAHSSHRAPDITDCLTALQWPPGAGPRSEMLLWLLHLRWFLPWPSSWHHQVPSDSMQGQLAVPWSCSLQQRLGK